MSVLPRGRPAAVLLLGALVLVSPGVRAAESARHFDIPAEPLAAALDEFARQADVTLLFSSTLAARARTAGVHGDLTVNAALSRLLRGTALGFRQVSPSAIAIIEPSGPAAAG
ncbi:MAG TPA: STN domain-containing protein, partial [Steroidobacteraceae bacterium]|nr:STN domain-containing protein [Steroidobacteraceae bacterium]